jgi:hypothetical protein
MTELADRVAALEAEVARLKEELASRNGGQCTPAVPFPPGPAVPTTVSAEAAARVAELGMRREFEQMLDHARQTIPNLSAIDVTRYDDPDEPGQPRVLIGFITDTPSPAEKDEAWWRWTHWEVQAFPPHVLRWFGAEMRYRG